VVNGPAERLCRRLPRAVVVAEERSLVEIDPFDLREVPLTCPRAETQGANAESPLCLPFSYWTEG
jgi:hypothetical protein